MAVLSHDSAYRAVEIAVDGGSLYHAAHGLHIYRNRVFGIRDPSKPQPKIPLCESGMLPLEV